jgi:Cu/Ag efflux protein CusF
MADQPAPVAKAEESYTGTVKSVDPKEHVLKVEGLVLSKQFNLGANCTYSYVRQDKDKGTVDNLRPGQKVKVSYENASGVLVANRIEQLPQHYRGRVRTVDAEKHELTIRMRGVEKTLRIADDCKVALRADNSSNLADLKPGQIVTVLYETPDTGAVAREITQNSVAFVGTVTAIDVTDRTLKAKGLIASKKFNVGDGCMIVLDGKSTGLSSLKPGDKLEFRFDEVNGVNVVNRITEARESSPPPVTARADNVPQP